MKQRIQEFIELIQVFRGKRDFTEKQIKHLERIVNEELRTERKLFAERVERFMPFPGRRLVEDEKGNLVLIPLASQ